MFSFLKFFNSKSDADKNKMANGRTLNPNGSEARALRLFNTRSPVARKPTRANNSSYSSDCKETVLSPGFSFRIAQRAREVRSTIPGSNSSNSYTLENSLNSVSTSTTNGINTSRDVYDKKRKLMETLDNFGVRKRTRLESGVDSIVNRRRRTISESNGLERGTIMHECNYRPAQPALPVTCLKTVHLENNITKTNGDFESICQKKPRTRNNEILSSYSSSKFLVKPGQKRPHQTDYDCESPKRKHCKSCTCCGSTILLLDDQNNLNKSDKTTETDLSDDLVTVAAGRIFNRSGKTQVVKKMCMKTILNEVLEDDDDLTPYTSIDKVEEKKKKAQKKVISVEQCTEKPNKGDGSYSADLVTSVPSTITTKFNGVQAAETGILSGRSSTTSAPIATVTATPFASGVNSNESPAKINEANKSAGSLQFNFGSPKVSAEKSIESDNKKTNEVNEKSVSSDQTPESTAFQMPKSTVQVSNKSPLRSPDKNENVPSKDVSSSFTFGGQTEGASKPPTFTFGAPKPLSNSTMPLMQFGATKSDNQVSSLGNQSEKSQVDGEQSTPVMKFGAPKIDDKPSTPTIQFGVPKIDDSKSTPVMQFGVPKVDGVKTTPVLQFGSSKVDEIKSIPALQFGTPKVDDVKSTPIVQFGAPKDDGIKSTPVMQFGVPKVDGKQSTPIIQFGVPKSDNQQSVAPLQFGSHKESENSTSTSLFSFGKDAKSVENTKSTEPLKFQFGTQKSSDNASLTESKNVGFGSNSVQNQNLFSFGKTDPPKYDASVDKSTPKFQFGALSTPVFGTSNADQSKASVNQPIDNKGPKLAFGNQVTDNKPATSTPGMLFTNNTANPIFQFNSSHSKPNDTATDKPNSSFAFNLSKLPPAFGTSAPQDFGGKSAFQFSSPKTEESKPQFSTPAFGSQSTTNAPFKFGDSNKPTSFGSTFPPSSQPLQFANNPEKPTAEPFKFGSVMPPGTTGTFQFNANKVDSGPVKFGQNSSTFPTPGFSGFGSPVPQPTTSFGSVPPPQPSPFGNMASPAAVPAFGNVASPPSNAFGTAQSFQFGSTNNTPSTSSTFAFGASQPSTKPDGGFNFSAPPKTASPFQFGQTQPAMSTSQFGGTQPQGAFGFGSPPMSANGLSGSSQPLFSMGTAPVVERRKAKAVRRRQ